MRAGGHTRWVASVEPGVEGPEKHTKNHYFADVFFQEMAPTLARIHGKVTLLNLPLRYPRPSQVQTHTWRSVLECINTN